MERISGLAMQELDDEALGWFSRRLPWGSYGMLARASLSAPTLGVALKRWCRHHGLIADDIALTLGMAGDTATASITEQRDLGELREFCLVSVLRNILGVACWLIDSRIPLLSAQLPFAAPLHREVFAGRQAQLLTVLVRQMGLCPLGPVASAAAALELCRQHWPELAILDVHLHGDTDGIELARRLQQLGQLPLLFLSGAEDAHTLGQLEQMQPLAFLPKPYQYADLQHIITQGLALGGAGGGPPGTRARPPDPRVL